MRRGLRLLSAIIFACVMLCLPYGSVSAQSNAISINPRRDFTLNPGESLNENLSVTNTNQQQPLSLTLDVMDFDAQNETGAPALINDLSKEPTAWSIRNFTTIPKQVTLEKGKTTNVPIKIKMPNNIGAGSYYGAVRYAVSNPEDPNKVNIAASSVTLIFITVPGTAKELLSFKSFGAFIPDATSAGGTFSGLFIDKKPQVLAYRVKNDGNLAEQPKGSMSLKDMFGKTVYKIENANPKQQLALLGQTRRFEACIKGEKETVKTPGNAEVTTEVCKEPSLKPGRYTAQLSVLYGQNGGETREITAATSFWYLPWWFIAVILVVLGALAGLITFIVFKVRAVTSRR